MVGERRLIWVTLVLACLLAAPAAFGQDEEGAKKDTPAAAEPPKDEAPAAEPVKKEAPATEPAKEAAPVAEPPKEEAPAAEPGKSSTLEGMWRDLLHYIQIAQVDAARSTGEALLASKPKPTDIYDLAVRIPESMTVLVRGSNLKGMREIVDSIRDLNEQGYRAEITDPERIQRSIDMLGGGLESFEQAIPRLKFHGEYAVSELVRKLMEPGISNTLKARIITVLPMLGKDAVRPLSEGLQASEPLLQEVFAKSLGQIGYPHALPRLKELLDRKGILESVRKAAEGALVACGGKEAMGMSAAALYYQQAEKYYYRSESLLPDSRFEQANLWVWRDQIGLVAQAVPRQIFCDIYAMRYARLALEHDPQYYQAVSLWIAADLDREANIPAGKTDPLRGPDQPPPKFYALAGSPRYLKDVVRRAMNDYNTPVAMGALRALVRTAGAQSLLTGEGGLRPLVDAMSYPDREVRFFAAVSLAAALPKDPFEGSKTVLGVLNTALRQSGGKVAMLICAELPQRNLLKGILREAGFIVIDAADVENALAGASDASGVDLVVLGSRVDALPVMQLIRNRPLYARMPFVVVKQSRELRQAAQKDERLVLVDPEQVQDELKRAANKAMTFGVGKPLSSEDATQWSVTAAERIRELGLTGNKAFDLSLVQKALIESLGDKRQPVRIASAQALAVMDDADAQRAVAALAILAAAPDSVRVPAFQALGQSIRRFGNQLTEEQVKAIIDLVTGQSDMALREAAAQALGAMNLASQDIIPLIKAFPGQ